MLDAFWVRNELSHMLGRRTCVVSQVFIGPIVTCFILSWDIVKFYLSFSLFCYKVVGYGISERFEMIFSWMIIMN
jgi:hypothetical protein